MSKVGGQSKCSPISVGCTCGDEDPTGYVTRHLRKGWGPVCTDGPIKRYFYNSVQGVIH